MLDWGLCQWVGLVGCVWVCGFVCLGGRRNRIEIEYVPLLDFVETGQGGDGDEDDDCLFAVTDFDLWGLVQVVSKGIDIGVVAGYISCISFKESPQNPAHSNLNALMSHRSYRIGFFLTSLADTNCKGRSAVFISGMFDSRSYRALAILFSSSEGFCLDGLVGAILLRAAMIAVCLSWLYGL